MTEQPRRLQKLLAEAGIASRRKAEELIRAGRVTVNGQVAGLGDKACPTDRVAVDGAPVTARMLSRARVLAYHKPTGEICTRDDPQGRPTVFDGLPELPAGRWISVGRLDINSSGLILLTTDGDLANALMHPRQAVRREYRVRVLGEVSQQMLQKLKTGVDLEDGLARFRRITASDKSTGANRWFTCELQEGRNREVRRLWEAVGCQVSRLIRTRYGTVRLPRDLSPGKYAELDSRQLAQLYRCCGIETE